MPFCIIDRVLCEFTGAAVSKLPKWHQSNPEDYSVWLEMTIADHTLPSTSLAKTGCLIPG